VARLTQLSALPPAPNHLKENAAWKATYQKSLKVLVKTLDSLEASMAQHVATSRLTDAKVEGWDQQRALIRERLKATILRAKAVLSQIKAVREVTIDVNETNNRLSKAARDVGVTLANIPNLNQRGANLPEAPANLLNYLNGWHTGGMPNYLRNGATLNDRDQALAEFKQVIAQVEVWARQHLGMA
jgi:hypothetical protein